MRPARKPAAPVPDAGRREASRTPGSARSAALSASWRVPWERSVYHPEDGRRLGDTVARQSPEKADRKVDVELDIAGTVAAREHATTLVAESQRDAVAVRDSERQGPIGRASWRGR